MENLSFRSGPDVNGRRISKHGRRVDNILDDVSPVPVQLWVEVLFVLEAGIETVFGNSVRSEVEAVFRL